MKEYYKEILASVILFISISLIFLIINFFDNYKFDVKYLIGYLLLFLIIVSTNSKNKYVNKVKDIIAFPMHITHIILTIIQPITTILFHIIIYFSITVSITQCIFFILNYNLAIHLKESTILYLKITIIVFISVLGNNILMKVINWLTFKYFKFNQDIKNPISNYILSTENIRYTIYLGYVIILIIVNIYNFQEKGLTNSMDKDKSILQSFVTFIAFERAQTLFKHLTFKPSILLKKIKNTIINEFKGDFNEKTK